MNDRIAHINTNPIIQQKIETKYQNNFYENSLLFSFNFQVINNNIKNIIFIKNKLTNKFSFYKNYDSKFFYIKNKLVLPSNLPLTSNNFFNYPKFFINKRRKKWISAKIFRAILSYKRKLNLSFRKNLKNKNIKFKFNKKLNLNSVTKIQQKFLFNKNFLSFKNRKYKKDIKKNKNFYFNKTKIYNNKFNRFFFRKLKFNFDFNKILPFSIFSYSNSFPISLNKYNLYGQFNQDVKHFSSFFFFYFKNFLNKKKNLKSLNFFFYFKIFKYFFNIIYLRDLNKLKINNKLFLIYLFKSFLNKNNLLFIFNLFKYNFLLKKLYLNKLKINNKLFLKQIKILYLNIIKYFGNIYFFDYSFYKRLHIYKKEKFYIDLYKNDNIIYIPNRKTYFLHKWFFNTFWLRNLTKKLDNLQNKRIYSYFFKSIFTQRKFKNFYFFFKNSIIREPYNKEIKNYLNNFLFPCYKKKKIKNNYFTVTNKLLIKYNLKNNIIKPAKNIKKINPVFEHNPLSVHSSNSLIHVLTNLVKIVRDEELANKKKLEKLSKEKLIFDKKHKWLEHIDLIIKKKKLYKKIFYNQIIFSKKNQKVFFRKNNLIIKKNFMYYKNFFLNKHIIYNNFNFKNNLIMKNKNYYKEKNNNLLFFSFKGFKKFQSDNCEQPKKTTGISFLQKFRRYVRAKTRRNKSLYYKPYKMFSAYDYAKIKYRNKLIYLLPKNINFNSLKSKFILKNRLNNFFNNNYCFKNIINKEKNKKKNTYIYFFKSNIVSCIRRSYFDASNGFAVKKIIYQQNKQKRKLYFRYYNQFNFEKFIKFINLLYKKNWLFFFKLDDLFLYNYNIFINYINHDLYINKINYQYINHDLYIDSLLIKQKTKNKIKNQKRKFKIYVLWDKRLLFFLKSTETFLFFKDSFVYFFCFKTKKIKQKNLFLWKRIKTLTFYKNFNIYNFTRNKIIKSKVFIFNKIKIKTLNLFYNNNKINFIKIFNKIFILGRLAYKKFSNNLFYKGYYYLKNNNNLSINNFNKKILFFNYYKSYQSLLLFFKRFSNLSSNYKFFFYKIYDKLINYRYFNNIFQFLYKIKKYNNIIDNLRFYFINGKKHWFYFINGNIYFWDTLKKIWKLKNNKNYFFNYNGFNYYNSSIKIKKLKYRSKIFRYNTRQNLVFKYGFIFRWTKNIFNKRLYDYFFSFRKRVFFMKWWQLITSKNIKINIPFLSINTNFLKKNFNSIKTHFKDFFFFKHKPFDLLKIDYIWPKAFFQNIIVFKEFFSKLLHSLTVFRFFLFMIKHMQINEQKFDNNFFILFNYAKRLFSGFYWSCLNTNQKKTFIFNDKYKPIHHLSDFFLFFKYSVFKNTDMFNYFFKLSNKFSLSNIKRFLFYQRNKFKTSFNNFYNINKFFKTGFISYKRKNKI